MRANKDIELLDSSSQSGGTRPLPPGRELAALCLDCEYTRCMRGCRNFQSAAVLMGR